MVAEPIDAERPWLVEQPKKPRKYPLSDFQRRLLLEQYDGRTETTDRLMRYFPNTPRWVVRKYAGELGLARQKEPRWSEWEIAYLDEYMHRVRVEKIAKRLGRTVTAVKLKAKRLGISKSGEGYTLRGLCDGLGVDHHKVEKWLAAGWLRGERRGSARSDQQGGDMWYFSDRNVYELVRDHPAEIDPRRVEWLWLVDILINRGR